ncbi:MAG: DNA polymerase III subunit delta [Parachlamydia sp.]|nr:DNA polymerase III subunit delta [Parachlamydia sp.]
MKYTSLRALEAHLTEAAPDHLAALYAILGKDDFLRKTAYARLKQFLPQSDLAMTVLEGDGVAIKALSNALYSSSLFSQKSCVVIHTCDKLTKPCMEWLEAYFAKPTPQLILILTASTLHHGTTFFKKIEKYGVVLDIAEEKPWEKERSCTEWVHQTLTVAGKSLDSQTALALVKQVGTDGETLKQEMEKLLCYIGERREISPKDIQTICTGINSETVWQLGEAIFRLDAPTALRISHALLEDGTPLLSLLRQIRSQFQTDLQVCAILANGGAPSDITSQFAYMKGNILERHCQAARNYGLLRFKEGLLKIDASELQAKNGAPELNLMEGLIVRLTR